MTYLEKDIDGYPGDSEKFISWFRRRYGLKRAFEFVFLVGGTRMWVPIKYCNRQAPDPSRLETLEPQAVDTPPVSNSSSPFHRLDEALRAVLVEIYGGSEVEVPTSVFTPKEQPDAILACIDLGMGDNDIAMHLHCSSRVVRDVRSRTTRKLIADAARRLGLSRDHFTSYREDLQS